MIMNWRPHDIPLATPFGVATHRLGTTALLEKGQTNSGSTPQQIQHFVTLVSATTAKHPHAVNYSPGSIL